MKKGFVFIIAVFLVTIGYGQMAMSPSGMLSQEGLNYIVIEAKGDQQELYNRSLTYLNSLYNSPQDVLSSVEGEAITVNGYAEKAIKSAYKRLRYTYDLRYSINIEFKDNKIKFQINHWEAGPLVNVGDYKIFRDSYGVYSEGLELQNERAKESLETFFNGFLTDYRQEVSSKSDW